MSVNQCSTDCRCGFWSFLHEPDGDVLIGDKSLLTIDEYLTAIGSTRDRTNSGHRFGYGYRNELNGEVYGWYNKQGCYASFDAGPGYEKRLLWTYEPIPEADRYRWRQLTCPFCNRTYAGWYRLQPHGLKRNGYELYDLSFWWGFSDEPDRRDECWLREWTVDEVRLMLSRWKLR